MEHHISHSPLEADEDMVFEFLETSRRLLSLIEHENKIMEESGCLSIESYLMHRDALLKKYEDTVFGLMNEIDKVGNIEALSQLMAEEIVTLKQALNDNTHKKIKSLQQALTTSQNSDINSQGDASWH
ncbi:MAG: hypothetical protein KDJ50_03875 [Alphaproteobacteria bacterium]|nr:hypothetical protein [Alphaproteobacteria bacterium]